jgi:hypothetical protein
MRATALSAKEGATGVPYYYSEAATADGQIRKRVLKAYDKKDADRQLRKLGLHPISIETTQHIRQKKQEKVLHRRHIIRNTVLIVVALSLVGGAAGYLVLLDLKSAQSAFPDGILRDASDINYGATPEQRVYANHVNDLLKKNFPGYFRNVNVKTKAVMLIYESEDRPRLDRDVEESVLTMVTRGFQRQFGTRRCEVGFVRDEKTVAEARFQDGKVTTSIR